MRLRFAGAGLGVGNRVAYLGMRGRRGNKIIPHSVGRKARSLGCRGLMVGGGWCMGFLYLYFCILVFLGFGSGLYCTVL